MFIKSLSNIWFKRVKDCYIKWGPTDFCLKRAERNLLCKSLPLWYTERLMFVFSKKLNSFREKQHSRPLQTPLVSLMNYHTMPGCLYCIRGVWWPLVSIQNPNNTCIVEIYWNIDCLTAVLSYSLELMTWTLMSPYIRICMAMFHLFFHKRILK